ncbi:ATP-binding protein [Kitasatospora sp. NPDC058263]
MAAEPRTVRDMRALARTVGGFREVPDEVLDDLLVIISEFVSNVVQHSGSSDVTVKLVFGARSLSVAVRDTGQWVQPKPQQEETAEGGRGTRLCRRLPCVLAAGRHHPARGGTVAWAHLTTAPPRTA